MNATDIITMIARASVLMFVVAFAAQAATIDDDLRAAQQLAWLKRFAESETLYRHILDRNPKSRAASLGLGQVLLWEQRYANAARVYRDLLRNAPNDVDARKGLATAEYWSGDYRSAQRDFAVVLRARPNDIDARKASAEIASTMAPVVKSENVFVTDDQPLRHATMGVSTTFFSDPLTSWTATAGVHVLSARGLGLGSATAPFVSITASTSIPAPHLRAGVALRLLRFPDGTTKPLGGISLTREWSHTSIAAEIDRHEILYTVSALRAHPSETTASLAWNRNTDTASSSAALHSIRYFDGNHGRAAEAYHLVRIVKRERASFSIGASASYRDTSESRFRFIGNGGLYDPYWTPRDLVDVRGIVAATVDTGRVKVRLQGDSGWAHDHAPVFGPAEVARTFHPWRASADVTIPLGDAFTGTLGVERQATVFYRATAIRLGFSGRL
jgi:tetratricopeptide (TPR) repeat protein